MDLYLLTKFSFMKEEEIKINKYFPSFIKDYLSLLSRISKSKNLVPFIFIGVKQTLIFFIMYSMVLILLYYF